MDLGYFQKLVEEFTPKLFVVYFDQRTLPTLVDTQKLVAPEIFQLKSNVLTHEPLISMMKNAQNHCFLP